MKTRKTVAFLVLLFFPFLNIALAENYQAEWAKTVAAAPDASVFYGMVSDSSGNFYAVGAIGAGNFDFGNGVTVSGDATTNVILVKYNSAGSAQWARSVANATDPASLASVTIDNNGDPCAVGSLNGASEYDFGNDVTVQGKAASGNAFLIKYSDVNSGESSAGSVKPKMMLLLGSVGAVLLML